MLRKMSLLGFVIGLVLFSPIMVILSTSYDDCEKNLELVQRIIKQLRDEIAAMRPDVMSLRSEVENAKKTKENLETQLEQAKQINPQLEATLNTCKDNLKNKNCQGFDKNLCNNASNTQQQTDSITTQFCNAAQSFCKDPQNKDNDICEYCDYYFKHGSNSEGTTTSTTTSSTTSTTSGAASTCTEELARKCSKTPTPTCSGCYLCYPVECKVCGFRPICNECDDTILQWCKIVQSQGVSCFPPQCQPCGFNPVCTY